MPKQVLRYLVLLIPSKLRIELRLTIDSDRTAEYKYTNDGNTTTSMTLYPLISISIIRPSEFDEDGTRKRAPWNPNDHLAVTKYNFAILMNALSGIQEDMKTKELFSYNGDRLELNEKLANKFRRIFPLNLTTVELSPVVIIGDNEVRVEGVRFKINNDQSTVLLTVNELCSLIYNLEHLDIDSIAMIAYTTMIERKVKTGSFGSSSVIPLPTAFNNSESVPY